jgi:hypothetical protein
MSVFVSYCRDKKLKKLVGEDSAETHVALYKVGRVALSGASWLPCLRAA